MIFVRTALGILVVACVVALGGLGYRLWEVQRALGSRVKTLEQRVDSTQKEVDALHAALEAITPAAETEAGPGTAGTEATESESP